MCACAPLLLVPCRAGDYLRLTLHDSYLYVCLTVKICGPAANPETVAMLLNAMPKEVLPRALGGESDQTYGCWPLLKVRVSRHS